MGILSGRRWSEVGYVNRQRQAKQPIYNWDILGMGETFRINIYLNSQLENEISNSSMAVLEFKIPILESVWERK